MPIQLTETSTKQASSILRSMRKPQRAILISHALSLSSDIWRYGPNPNGKFGYLTFKTVFKTLVNKKGLLSDQNFKENLKHLITNQLRLKY